MIEGRSYGGWEAMSFPQRKFLLIRFATLTPVVAFVRNL